MIEGSRTIFQETNDLILVNIDNGRVCTSSSETVDLPEVPPAAADRFTQRYLRPRRIAPRLRCSSDACTCCGSCRCASLQIHFDLHQCQRASCTDVSEQRARRRAWQRNLNRDIQRAALELMVNIFRFLGWFF